MTSIKKIFLIILISVLGGQYQLAAQDFEWRLNNVVYNFTDPDGSGPATGSCNFTLQIKAVTAPITITGMTTGWSWQSVNAMLPTGGTGIVCGGVTNSGSLQPSNVVMSSAMSAASFTYNAVNQCSGNPNFTEGGQVFDRRAVGTIDGGTIAVPSATWLDVFTVTLWSMQTTFPQAGYAVINSAGVGSTPGRFASYGVSDAAANSYVVNSLTYGVALPLGASTVPVSFGGINALCRGNGTLISWTTEMESNSSHFNIERSLNGTEWSQIGTVPAAGNSSVRKSYQFAYPQGGKAMFRIKQADINGNSMISEVASADCANGSVNPSQIFPIPARDVVNVRVYSETSQRSEFTIMDATGRKMRSKAAGLIAGYNTVQMNVTGLAAGNYSIIIIRENKETETIKFVKD